MHICIYVIVFDLYMCCFEFFSFTLVSTSTQFMYTFNVSFMSMCRDIMFIEAAEYTQDQCKLVVISCRVFACCDICQ